MQEEIERLRRKTFVFFDTYDDEIYFKMMIRKYVENPPEVSFFKYIWQLVYDRNKISLKDKYIHEKKGKMYIDRDLIKWCKLIKKEFEEELKKVA